MSRARLRLAAACLAPAILAACSETMLRRDSLSQVTIDDQTVIVSWTEVAPRSVDLIVSPAPGEAATPLAFRVAEAAAGRVAARRCLFDRARPEFPPVHYPSDQFAFRYICGD